MALPHFRRIIARKLFGHVESLFIDRIESNSRSFIRTLHTCFPEEPSMNTKAVEAKAISGRTAHLVTKVAAYSSFVACSPFTTNMLLSRALGFGGGRACGLTAALTSQESHTWRREFRTATSLASGGLMGGEGVEIRVPEGGFLALNDLRDKSGARHAAKRVGRGIGTGKGKTAGRGHKGQKARSGNKPRLGFEGGQTPLRKRIPRRGFHNRFSYSFQSLNLEKIAKFVEVGRIDASQVITMKTLRDAGALGKKIEDGVKLLGRGCTKFSLPINIEVSRVSGSARAAIEGAGGSVTRVHYTRLGLRGLLTPEWFAKKGRLLPKPARPPPGILAQVDRLGEIPGAGQLPQSLKKVESAAVQEG